MHWPLAGSWPLGTDVQERSGGSGRVVRVQHDAPAAQVDTACVRRGRRGLLEPPQTVPSVSQMGPGGGARCSVSERERREKQSQMPKRQECWSRQRGTEAKRRYQRASMPLCLPRGRVRGSELGGPKATHNLELRSVKAAESARSHTARKPASPTSPIPMNERWHHATV